jgi:phosphatidate cytidylyltransferase
MTDPDPGTRGEPPSLRSAFDPDGASLRATHRARHMSAAPGPYSDLADIDSIEPARPGEPTRQGEPASTEAVADARAARTGAAADAVAQAPPASRAGRNLPAAIGVGLVLAATVLASLLFWKPAFFAVLLAAFGIGTWELVRAIRTSGANPPMVPLLLGGAAMAGLAWYGGPDALTYGLIGTTIATLVWRLGDGPEGYHRDVVPALLVAVYVPFLGGFAALLARPEDGHYRVLATLAGVVLSDTGGYIAGVFFGRHPMAPSVSPKKSWEGFAGSLIACAAGSAVLLPLLPLLMHAQWWHGVVFGLAVAVAATLGDLAESLLKRDLGVKDMSSLLPGHGGLMDRLDSILFAAPTAYAVLTLLPGF